MSNLTYHMVWISLLATLTLSARQMWRDAMQDIIDLLELEQPPDTEMLEEELFAHFQYMYIRYVQVSFREGLF